MILSLNNNTNGDTMIDSKVFSSTEKELIIQYLYKVEDYFTFNIKIKSGEFSGSSNFCISKEKVISTIETLTEMYNTFAGSCAIKDYDSDSHICLEMGKFGQINLYGQIGGSHEDHNMRFKYILDQTILPNLIQIFRDTVKE